MSEEKAGPPQSLVDRRIVLAMLLPVRLEILPEILTVLQKTYASNLRLIEVGGHLCVYEDY